MSVDIKDWTNKIWNILEQLPGSSDVVARERQKWEVFEANAQVRIVIFGAYDAGKSSLLKRILVQSGVDIPSWLTVSSYHETFEVCQVDCGQLTFLDTPGLASGNLTHDQQTLEAMKLADAFLWVLPPQLITSDPALFTRVLCGELMVDVPDKVKVVNSTIAVIARIDEAGVDPEDNLTGFLELSQRKVSELRQILEKEDTNNILLNTFAVVADPYQLVGNDPDPSIEDYHIASEWDGIDALLSSLNNLSLSSQRLRQYAGARYVAILAFYIKTEIQTMLKDNQFSLSIINNEISATELQQEKLNNFTETTLRELEFLIEEALSHIVRSFSNFSDESLINLKSSLEMIIDKWLENAYGERNYLANELECEFRERINRPSFRKLSETIDEIIEQSSESPEPDKKLVKNAKKILSVASRFRDGFQAYAKAELGMSLEAAASRLRDLEASGKTLQEFIKAQGKSSTFSGLTHFKKAKDLVKWEEILDYTSPLIEQLAILALELTDDILSSQQAEERASKRRELREKLRIQVQVIKNEASSEFIRSCQVIESWMFKNKNGYLATKVDLEKMIFSLQSSLTLLTTGSKT